MGAEQMEWTTEWMNEWTKRDEGMKQGYWNEESVFIQRILLLYYKYIIADIVDTMECETETEALRGSRRARKTARLKLGE